MDREEKLGLVKDYFKNKINDTHEEKTHVITKDNHAGHGITDWYTPKELIKFYGDCECARVYYEKDYGDGAIAIEDFLVVYADKVIEKK